MASPDTLTVTIIDGPAAGRAVTLEHDRLVVGRAAGCDLVLPDSTASRQHCAFEREGRGFVLVDLGSANGTFVEGQKSRVNRHTLRHGEEIVVGKTRLRVELPQADPIATHLPPSDATVAGAVPDATVVRGRGSTPTIGAQAPADLTIVLTIVKGPDRGMVYAPAKDVITIGRLTTSDVPLSDGGASRLHATIKREAGGYAVYDESSLNGIELGVPPKRVIQSELKDGDVLRIGDSEIRVEIGSGQPARADETVLTATIGDKTFAMSLKGLAGRGATAESDITVLATATPERRIILRVVNGPDRGAAFEPSPATTHFTVGRTERADYRVADPAVSGVHISITRQDGAFVLKDETSRNGTYLNGNPERVATAPLAGGEEIRIGGTTMRVEIVGPGAPASKGGEDRPDGTVVMPRPAAGGAAPKPKAPGKPEALLPELARSAAAKERISKIMKGVSLRPIRRPGTPRQWAALGFALVAVLVSYGFTLRARPLLSAGPVHKGHADIESRCETCHIRAGTVGTRAAMNVSCVAAECHVKALKNKEGVRDDCISCHTEHRGRTFPISGGERRCWSCHEEGYRTRPMQLLVTEDAALKAHLTERLHATEIGLKFSHSAHDGETKGDKRYDTCVGCHPQTQNGRTFRMPGHAECLECHKKEEVSADTVVAQQKAGPQCLLCHVRQDGTMTRPPSERFAFVAFSHRDHTDDGCKRCHAGIWSEGPYRSVVRAPEIYPVAMDACFTCHQQRAATVKCLACHREHHSFPTGGTATLAGATTGGGFQGFLLLMLAAVLGGMGYTYADMRMVRRFLAPPPPPPAAVAAAPAGGAAPAAAAPEIMPFPKVDVEACISCGSCYGSCPKDVLKGNEHGKSTVVNPNSCTALEGCAVCEQGCPTGAIRVTTAPLTRTVERPDIDEHNEAKIPGLFFGGEVIGAALIKSAINHGHQAVTYVDEKKPKVPTAPYDIIIVGAGPGGLGAALEAKRRGMRYLLLERDTVASTIKNYPRDKAVLAEPVKVPLYGMLPMMDAEKETLIEVWQTIVRKTGLEVHEHEEVTDVRRQNDVFTVKTVKGEYQGAYVLLTIGTRGNPRKLGVPGEEPGRVCYNLIDAAEWAGKHVVVVGGGDSAIEAAVALAKQPGTTVTLSYRKSGFSRVKKRNQEAIEEMRAAGRIELLFESSVPEVRATTVLAQLASGERELRCDQVFALIGADAPKAWIEKLGVQFVTREEAVVAW